MTPRYVLFFDEVGRGDLALVGGKGANLGEMTGAGFPVPHGFCVTTGAYKLFIEQNRLSDFIATTVAGASLENITEVGAKLRERLQQSTIPEVLARAVQEAVKRIGLEHFYAVRSSATAEDLAFASFAGQQDTYLNVKGEKALLEAVRKCWASLFTDRAILYRAQNKIEHEKVYMSVVVQRMVLAQVSGIMFTADPVSGHRGMISIDASYGLGEALVSGLVSPDLYKFSKRDLKIASKTIADKKLAILPLQEGGTERVEISSGQSTGQAMEDAQIVRLAKLGMVIEKHYGSPQDIEWCLEDHQLYIVQSRAITSLFPLPEPRPKDDALHVYLSFNHLQVMTDPISPMGIDLLRAVITPDPTVRSQDGYKVLKAAAGRIYADASGLLRIRHGRTTLPTLVSNADSLLAMALEGLIQRPDFTTEISKNKGSTWAIVRTLAPILRKAVGNLLFKQPDGTVERMNRFIEEEAQKTLEAIHRSRPGVERLDAAHQAADLLTAFKKTVIPMLIPGVLAYRLLGRLEQQLLGSNHHTELLATGLEGNVTTEMGLQIGDLAERVGRSEALLEVFENPDHATLIERVNRVEDHQEFKQAFHEFMRLYGARAAKEIDIANPRWLESPELVAKSVRAAVETSRGGAHREAYRQTIEAAKAAGQELIQQVESRHGRIRGRIVARLVRVMRNYLPLREHHKFLMVKKLFVIKNVFLEEAQALVNKGHLEQATDVFQVGFWELREAVQNGTSLKELVEHRRAEYAHHARLTPPRLLTSEGEEIRASYHRKDLPAGTLPGISASAGVVEGYAKVITDPSKESLHKDEILVALFTDPGWTPLFINAAGLVMEIGGLLTHGTVVAREYGIPAVVGVSDATTKIRTGQRIRVDGDAGLVTVLEG